MLCTSEVTVQVPDGLHHQTAARFIQTANRFTSVVRVVYGDNNVNAKSLLGVLRRVQGEVGHPHPHQGFLLLPGGGGAGLGRWGGAAFPGGGLFPKEPHPGHGGQQRDPQHQVTVFAQMESSHRAFLPGGFLDKGPPFVYHP